MMQTIPDLPRDIINLILEYLDSEISTLDKKFRQYYFRKNAVIIDYRFLPYLNVVLDFVAKYSEIRIELDGDTADIYKEKVKLSKNVVRINLDHAWSSENILEYIEAYPDLEKIEGVADSSLKNFTTVKKYPKITQNIKFLFRETFKDIYREMNIPLVVECVDDQDNLKGLEDLIYSMVEIYLQEDILYPNLENINRNYFDYMWHYTFKDTSLLPKLTNVFITSYVVNEYMDMLSNRYPSAKIIVEDCQDYNSIAKHPVYILVKGRKNLAEIEEKEKTFRLQNPDVKVRKTLVLLRKNGFKKKDYGMPDFNIVYDL